MKKLVTYCILVFIAFSLLSLYFPVMRPNHYQELRCEALTGAYKMWWAISSNPKNPFQEIVWIDTTACSIP
ncbi:hypothetical protein JW930_03100 [Candidatus Woesearchaeota archaeon]|nr:hypothetical protein [Candidatus Woesearchaeota archaeon]